MGVTLFFISYTHLQSILKMATLTVGQVAAIINCGLIVRMFHIGLPAIHFVLIVAICSAVDPSSSPSLGT
jgi:hypothetical protein